MRGRTLLTIGLTGSIGVAASVACINDTYDGPTTAFAVTPFGACTVAATYTALTAAEVGVYCGTFTCGSTAYALCYGTSWDACNCGIPAGYIAYTGTVTFISGSGSGSSGGSTGSTIGGFGISSTSSSGGSGAGGGSSTGGSSSGG
jgi:hypothetical protein